MWCSEQAATRFRFHSIHLIYAIFVLAAAIAACQWWGIALALAILGMWSFVFVFSRSARPWVAASLLVTFSIVTMLFEFGVIIIPSRRHYRPSCPNRLMSLAVALQHYHDDYGTFPPPYIPDAAGKPMHSWRVLVLPYISHEARYKRYDFSEPWDSAKNRLCASEVIQEFQCPDCDDGWPFTNYFAIVGPGATWERGVSRRRSDFRQPKNTILLMQATRRNVAFLEPKDLTLDEATQILALQSGCGSHAGGQCVAMVDGRMAYAQKGTPRDSWLNFLSVDGGDDWPEPGPVTRFVGIYDRFAAPLVLGVLVLLPIPWILPCHVCYKNRKSRRSKGKGTAGTTVCTVKARLHS